MIRCSISGRTPFSRSSSRKALASYQRSAVRLHRSPGILQNDLRTDLRVVFLRGGRVDVGDLPRFDIHESGDFQRSNAVVRANGVVATGLIAVEPGRIDGGVAGAFLGRRAEKRTPRLGEDSPEPRANHRVMRKSEKTNLVKSSGDF